MMFGVEPREREGAGADDRRKHGYHNKNGWRIFDGASSPLLAIWLVGASIWHHLHDLQFMYCEIVVCGLRYPSRHGVGWWGC